MERCAGSVPPPVSEQNRFSLETQEAHFTLERTESKFIKTFSVFRHQDAAKLKVIKINSPLILCFSVQSEHKMEFFCVTLLFLSFPFILTFQTLHAFPLNMHFLCDG